MAREPVHSFPNRALADEWCGVINAGTSQSILVLVYHAYARCT